MDVRSAALRRGALALAAAALAAGATAATASAETIGPTDLTSGTTASLAVSDELYTNSNIPAPGTPSAPGAGRLTSWQANFDCTSAGCADGDGAMLVVVHSTDGENGTVVAESPVGQAAAGVQRFQLDPAIPVEANDQIFVAPVGEAGIVIANRSPAGYWSFPLSDSGTYAFADADAFGSAQVLFNADFDAPASTRTTVSVSPNHVQPDDAVTYGVHVEATSGDGTAVPSGEVSLSYGASDSGDTVPGCGAVTLDDNGDGTCTTTAPDDPGRYDVLAHYAGDDATEASDSVEAAELTVRSVGSVSVQASQQQVLASGAITYTATVSPPIAPRSLVRIAAASDGNGTVAFDVDGTPIGDCQTQPVGDDATATCVRTAPAAAGSHRVTATYTGGDLVGPATGSGDFSVLAPALSAPAAQDLGSVTAGQSASRTITLTNSGTAPAHISAVTADGDGFAVVGGSCAGATLDAGATCDVQVAFSPSDAKAYTGTLRILSDAATSPDTVALSGTGQAVVQAPPATDTTPTPPPADAPPPLPSGPAKGATFTPGEPTVLPATTPQSGGAPLLMVPLTCASDQVCVVNGTLTVVTSPKAGPARAAKSAVQTIARFAKVRIRGGRATTLRLKLSASFVKKMQRAGVRRIHGTLTINTTLGSGQKVTTRQQVTVVLPKAAKAKAKATPKPAAAKKPAAKKPVPHFTG